MVTDDREQVKLLRDRNSAVCYNILIILNAIHIVQLLFVEIIANFRILS